MEIGTRVKAVKQLGGGFKQEVPADAEGFVVARRFGGDLEVAFTLPGLLGGTRTVNVPVEPSHVAPT
ncbi:hypothetical protein [Embleya sp. NBC_00896]|uniref:hypothetical protein n=1 Tax=Embleya sp. NBC_00896 TaxID=2975961 RepID=UPI002F917275|nr:hypothetical protein OG928_37825 [Embleya sp. NBC_00896]